MDFSGVRLLSIAPYRFLPATTGGHQGIALPAHYLGLRCRNDVISVAANQQEHGYAFHLHPALSDKPARYLPFAATHTMLRIAKECRSTHILCDHPYLFPAAYRAGKQLSLPVFLRSHNIESERFRGLGKRWWRAMHSFEGWAMRKADGVFFVTEEDRQWALRHYRLHAQQSHTAPFGTPLQAPPPKLATDAAAIRKPYGIAPDAAIYYFLGALSYQPNADAARILLSEIVPRLKQTGKPFHLMLVGKGLPEDVAALAKPHQDCVTIAGFVEDLEQLLSACQVMLNPVLTGGGIKTKAVEALAHGNPVVSTESGAAGLERAACGAALSVVADNDWQGFAEAGVQMAQATAQVPSSFFQAYYWGSIVEGMLRAMVQTR